MGKEVDVHLSSGCCQHCKCGHLPRFAMKCPVHGFPDGRKGSHVEFRDVFMSPSVGM